MTTTLTVAAGILTGLSLIVAIGAQNVFVLRQGLLRRHIGIVVIVCAASDAVLITAAVAGVGGLIATVPVALEVLRWGGVVFLSAYGLMALRRAVRPGRLDPNDPVPGGVRTTAAGTLTTALALTWLNPHVYLDVLMLASLAHQQGDLRWWFAGGLVVASITWFAVLGYGAAGARRLLTRPATWRVLDTAIGVVMLMIAARLAASPLVV